MNPTVNVAPDDQDVDNPANMITPEGQVKMQMYEDHLLLARRLGVDTSDYPNGRVYINLPRSQQIDLSSKLDKKIGHIQLKNQQTVQEA